ncbi:metallo-beta-lactamase family protein [Dyella jiangningensis]|nr:metallo-beta-lactamase family protein [Dyella sp. AtDHG13]SDL39521.1 metallo-beta-lactamase family protein [Dyella jiangningensis]
MAFDILYRCHGAAREVTGSCHHIECNGRNVLIDCGLFQGGADAERANAEPFAFDPACIHALLLTHAHLDHCGRLPLLVRQGFRGRIHATSATIDLARIVLLDAAGLQEEDARRAQRRGRRRGQEDAQPLFTLDDVFRTMDYFSPVAYEKCFDLTPGIRARFLDAGHILGSASILLEILGGERKVDILFSGDLGNPGHPLLRNAKPAPPSDYVVMETTYGDRAHRPQEKSIAEFYDAISTTLRREGNVIIPTFALERAQEVLYQIKRGRADGHLPPRMSVFLDSPMAISATDIFRRHPECFGSEFLASLRDEDPFGMPGLHFTRDVADSMAINQIAGGAVILAGSGMCTGGRVRHHLKHNLWNEKNGVIFVGYAAEGTLARRIIDGAREVRIFDEPIHVRSSIWTINGFSAHADQHALLDWLGTSPRRQVLLVHGEYARGMRGMADQLLERGIPHYLPAKGQAIRLT